MPQDDGATERSRTSLWGQVIRAFSFTASAVPVLAGAAHVVPSRPGDPAAVAAMDVRTAQLQLLFGVFFAAPFVLARVA